MQPEELAKDGIHLVTIEETSQLGLDEASQMSMNEPLVFNRPPSNPTTMAIVSAADMEIEDADSQPQIEIKVETVPPPPPTTEKPPTPVPDQIEMTEEIVESTLTASPVKNDNFIPGVELGNEMPDIPIPPELNNISPVVEETIIEEIVGETPAELKDNPEIMHPHIEIDLADIPQPPPSPTESEKNRRQEELDDLAMLGIDADDMAAQCM